MIINDVLVSVIMPCYNDEKFIRESISSVLSQTHSNLELLIVDDCSIDQSLKIINEYRKRDKRIRVFCNDLNRGAAFSRNLALRESKGEYIAFLDADDLWEKNKIELQLKFMTDNNYSFSYTNYSVIDENGNRTSIYFTGPKIITHSKFMKMSYVGCLTVMYKKDIYPDLQIPNDIYKRNDYALWLKLSEKTHCYLFNKITALYRKRSANSISSSKKTTLVKYHKDLFIKLYNFNKITATLASYNNAIHYIFKNLKYKKRTKSTNKV